MYSRDKTKNKLEVTMDDSRMITYEELMTLRIMKEVVKQSQGQKEEKELNEVISVIEFNKVA